LSRTMRVNPGGKATGDASVKEPCSCGQTCLKMSTSLSICAPVALLLRLMCHAIAAAAIAFKRYVGMALADVH
jgi:hypothetical protein